MITSSTYGIAIFHGIGDILNCTPIAKQLKINEPNCHITWFTAAKYRFILENNPFIDEIITLEGGDVLALDKEMPRLQAEREWTRFFTPAPYMNYDVLPGGSLLDLIKTAARLEWTFEFIPTFALTDAEKLSAREYWDALPNGKKILVETEFYSEQSHWKDDYAFEMAEELREIDPVYVFTAKNKPPFFDEFHQKYPRSVWCAEPFRLNAEFFNLSDAFIGVSSGISCVTFSDYCRRDIPRIEVSRGEHWSAAGYAHLSELYICYHRARFKEALQSLAARLSNSIANHDFSARFAPIAQLPNHKERVPCLACGSRQAIAVRGDDIVKCNDCGFHYLRDRMTTKAMEEYYTNVYAVDNPQAAPMVRVPPSKVAVDERPEFISSQRKELFQHAVATYGNDIRGGTLVDIGCGWGALLHNAKREGMNVIGFEFTAPNVEFGRSTLGLDIRQQQFTDADIAENSVDIVTMSHVLEHVPLPFEFLQKIEYVLKPGGIFTCVVPNFGSLCSEALREQWSWLERDWHYSQFTPNVLREMFAQAGFYVEECTTASGDFGKELPLAVLQKIQPNIPSSQLESTLERMNQSGMGEEIRIIGRKRGTSKSRYATKKTSVLWARTDAIGDATLSASMLPHIRARYPHASITVLCQQHLREFYLACPHVDIVVGFDKERAYRDEAYRNEIALGLQRRNFDIALNSVYSREPITDFYTLAVGAKQTFALDGALDNMNDAMRLQNNRQYTQIITSAGEWKSELDRHLDFLQGIGIEAEQLKPQVWLTQANEDYADTFFRENNLDPKKTVALFAGVLVDIRSYTQYGQALAPLCAEHGWTVLGFGTEKDTPIVQSQLDQTGARTINLCGKTTILQMAALLKQCTLSVGAETGAAHLASAVGVRNVVLLGGGHFGRFMPYSTLTSAVCLPLECYGCAWQCRYATPHCIRSVKQDILTEAIRQSYQIASVKPRVFVQDVGDWNPTELMPQWSWFYHWLKPNKVQIVRLHTEDIHRMNVHSPVEGDREHDEGMLVTAVISTYNSEKFMRGCLEDLTRQTLYKQGKLEILVIDACSEQAEGAIVKEFQAKFPHIRYERMSRREPLYVSWNYACTIARGKYIANTNADDRRRPTCLEKLASALESSGKGIAYSDLTFGKKENEPFESASIGEWRFPDFDPTLAVLYNLGCFTLLWRKTVWEAIGGFDTRYALAADFDFFTRVGITYGAHHVAEPLTMALLHDGQQSKKEAQMNEESNAIRAEFVKIPLIELFPQLVISTPHDHAIACISIGNAAMTLREPWYGKQIVSKPQAAALWYQKALEYEPANAVARYNIALLAAIVGQIPTARQLLGELGADVSDENRTAAEKFMLDLEKKGLSQEILRTLPIMEVALPMQSIAGSTENAKKSKPKILFTMYGWNESGGGTTYPRSIATRLQLMGYEVGVLYVEGPHPSVSTPYFVEEKIEQGIRLFGVYNRPTTFVDDANPLREIEDTNCVRLFEKVVDDFAPDVVHYHNFMGLSFAIADVAKKRGIPTVYTPHNYHVIDPKLYLVRPDLSIWKGVNLLENSELLATYPEKRAEYARRQAKAREMITLTIDYTLAVSRKQHDLLAEFAGTSERIAVVNQVPESTDWAIDTSKNTTAQRPLKFGFLGGIMALKGVHVLAHAAQNFSAESVEFHVYGTGLQEYKDLLTGIDRKKNLMFHGEYKREDLLPLASQLDAIILPSVWEDCAPLVIAEALALGLPVIAPNIGGFSDFITDGVNGRLYAYRFSSFSELANVIAEVVALPSLLDEWRKNIKLNYTFTDFVTYMAEFYNALARGERPTAQEISLSFKGETSAPIPQKITPTTMPNEPLNRLQFTENIRGGFSNKDARALMPSPLPSPLYLNLGCGQDVREGFVNIDLFSDDDRVVRMDIRRIDLQDNVADGVLASDVLEHFSHRETASILQEWARILKPGGEIIIRCPSLRLQMQAYQNGTWDADVASYMIFGGQTNPGDYHCIGFDERSIRKHLEQAGFEILSFEEVDTPQTSGFINLNMTVQARKKAQPQTPIFKQSPTINATKTVSEKQGNPQINLVWEGSQFVVHSLALINREQCTNVIESGVAEVTIVPFETDQFSAKGNPQFELLEAHDVRHKALVSNEVKKLPYVWVRHQWPPSTEEPKGAKWVIQQPWEFSVLRKDFVELFNRADEIWTPSNYSRNAFIASGVDFNKVQIVPNGVKPALFTPAGNRLELPTKKRFKFLFVGGTILRKGIDVLLQSYATTFTADDDVCLVIKDMGGDSFYKGQTAEAMIEQIRNVVGAPEIIYANSMMSEEDMAALYRTCDAFVSPYRGEGFSLPTLEAMACGLPVIVTEGGASDDFVDETVGWRITAGKRSIGNVISSHELTGEGFMLEPDGKVLSDILRYAFAHPVEGMHKGIAGSHRARTDWTWKRATMKMLSRLDVLSGTDMAFQAEAALAEHADGVSSLALAEDAMHHGDLDTAITLYQEAITLGGMSDGYRLLAIHRLAWISVADGDGELAREFIKKAAAIQEVHPDSLYIESLCCAIESQWVESLELLNTLLGNWKRYRYDVALGTTLDTLLCESGRALFQLGDLENAHELYTQALKMNPENADACYGTALCFREAGAIEEAITMYEWAVKLQPDYEEMRGEFAG